MTLKMMIGRRVSILATMPSNQAHLKYDRHIYTHTHTQNKIKLSIHHEILKFVSFIMYHKGHDLKAINFSTS